MRYDKNPTLSFCVLRSSSALFCYGYCAGVGDEKSLYYLSAFAQEFRLCHNWAFPLNRVWLAVIFLEPVPNSCCSTTRCLFRCMFFCRGQCSYIRLTHYFIDLILLCVYFHGTTTPSGTAPSHYRGFTITLRHTTLARTPLDRPVAENATWQNTTLTRDRHPCTRWCSNPQSQQKRGRIHTP